MRLPSILADYQDLSQAFLNLFTNTSQAIAEAHGRGTLSVSTALIPDRGGPWVEVRVSDDGALSLAGTPSASRSRATSARKMCSPNPISISPPATFNAVE